MVGEMEAQKRERQILGEGGWWVKRDPLKTNGSAECRWVVEQITKLTGIGVGVQGALSGRQHSLWVADIRGMTQLFSKLVSVLVIGF